MPAVDLRLDPDLRAFRAEISAFFRDEMTAERTRGHADPDDLTGLDIEFERAHQRRAGERGYLGISVPGALGGGGRPQSWKAIWAFEAAYHDAPSIDTAVTLCAGPLVAFGSAEQQRTHLPAMIRGEVLWAIAYTEPSAGSDLTMVQTTARRVGDGFVLDGHKALVTGAHKADWCLTIARTDPDASPRRGLSMFIVDLRTPGVERTRRRTANGWTLGEITFRDVPLSADALLGELHGGWRQLTAALVEERSGMAWLGWATRILDDLDTWAREAERHDARAPLAGLRAELAAGYRLAERVLACQDAGEPAIVESSMAKVWATELLQRIARTGTELLGVDGIVWSPLFTDTPVDAPLHGRIAWERIERIHPSISVGANELQRDTIARAGLGLGARPR
jgi:alkylation response protein AidB-like acyl-CoA dehydrogenase